MNLLALDPSFTATGWCVVELATERPVAMGVIRNPVLKDERAKRATAAENDARRGTIIRHAVMALVNRFEPSIAALEGDAGSQHAKAAKGLARAQQACVDALDPVGFPIFVTPQAVKKHAVGRLSTTDAEMREAMMRRWLDVDFAALLMTRPPYAQKPAPPGEWHNAIDALAVAACVWDDPAIASLRRTLAAMQPNPPERMLIDERGGVTIERESLEKLLRERPVQIPAPLQPAPRPVPNGSMILMYGGAPVEGE